MSFIPHTDADVREMLGVIGVGRIEDLFDEIPEAIRAGSLRRVPPGRSEMEMMAELGERARRDETELCFTGAGCYDHIPAAGTSPWRISMLARPPGGSEPGRCSSSTNTRA
jgi:glycine dehydrogenase subunit 1